MRAILGNRRALNADGEELKGKRATIIDFPDDIPLGEAFRNITDPNGVWAAHAAEGAKPAWVASESEGLSALVAEHYGCEVRKLEETR